MIDIPINWRLHLVAGAAGLAISLLLTPWVKRLAVALNCVDHPDRHRKLHDRVIPLGGGVAVLLAFIISTCLIVYLSDSQWNSLDGNMKFLLWLLAACVGICVVGLLDDRFGLRGRQKLCGQFLAASLLLPAGLIIERIQIFDFTVELGLLAIPFTFFWILGAINALNLIDGLDGMATSVGILLSLSIAGLALLTGHATEAFLAVAFAGSLAGFLVYNSPPASIFLGDAGSMLIGLVLGALAIRSSIKGPATVALIAPTAIWAIPVLDVSMAILRRRLTGRSIYTTDRGHLHHVLQRRGYSGATTVIFVGVLCFVTGTGALASVYTHHETAAIGAVLAIVAVLVVSRIFGHHELALIKTRGRHFIQSLIPMFRSKHPDSQHFRARLQGTKQWDELWTMLTDFADRFDLSRIQLNINLPAIGEEYHASWERKGRPDDAVLWHSEIPLIIHDRTVGRLLVTGACTEGSVCQWMGDLISGLRPLELQMRELLEEELGENPVVPVLSPEREFASTTGE